MIGTSSRQSNFQRIREVKRRISRNHAVPFVRAGSTQLANDENAGSHFTERHVDPASDSGVRTLRSKRNLESGLPPTPPLHRRESRRLPSSAICYQLRFSTAFFFRTKRTLRYPRMRSYNKYFASDSEQGCDQYQSQIPQCIRYFFASVLHRGTAKFLINTFTS